MPGSAIHRVIPAVIRADPVPPPRVVCATCGVVTAVTPVERKGEAGAKEAERANPIMTGFASQLSDDDMRNVAAWFASQKQKPAAAKDEKLIAAGQDLWRKGEFKKGVPACAGCHGPAGAGLPAQYPRLAGQYAEYTEAQLKAFRVEERANDPEKMMRTIAAKLSDVEIKAVAEYAAGLR